MRRIFKPSMFSNLVMAHSWMVEVPCLHANKSFRKNGEAHERIFGF